MPNQVAVCVKDPCGANGGPFVIKVDRRLLGSGLK
jgi:hypothetical protein